MAQCNHKSPDEQNKTERVKLMIWEFGDIYRENILKQLGEHWFHVQEKHLAWIRVWAFKPLYGIEGQTLSIEIAGSVFTVNRMRTLPSDCFYLN